MKKLIALTTTLVALNSYSQSLLYVKKNDKSGQAVSKLNLSQKSNISIQELKRKMLLSGKYEFVEEDVKLYEDSFTESPIKSNGLAWHHGSIDTAGAQQMIKSPNQVVVAVCDSGFEEKHPDLKGRSIAGFNFVDINRDTSPNTHHGTMVSGIIAGKYNSEFGTTGIAPFVKVMPLKITTTKGSTSLSTIVDCIKYAADNGAKVVNVSFTGVGNQSIQAAGKYARAKGTLLVYSAGNQGGNKKYPDHKDVLIVGGTQPGDVRWKCGWRCGSNYGEFVDLVAPAKSIMTTRAFYSKGGDLYGSPNGTSFSAPIVSAIAALVYSVNPFFTPTEVEEILLQSSLELNNEYVFGRGLVNAKRAVELALLNK